MSYKKLKKENITVSIEQTKDGELMIVVGMYEHENWLCCFPIRLVNFPEECENIDGFRSFSIDGTQTGKFEA